MMIILYSLFYYKGRILQFFNLKNIFISILTLIALLVFLFQSNIIYNWTFYYLFVPAFQGELGIFNVVIGRLYEVQDAYNQFFEQFNLGSIFFGNGFGASYQPNEFLRFFVIDYASAGAVQENLSRHIIHFGPVRFFFRYGLIGISLISYIFYRVIKELVKLFKGRLFDLNLFFSLTLFLYLLRFFIQPIFNDIMIIFCLII